MPETPIPQKQEAALITAAGGPEVLRLGTIPVPVPGPEEVLVEVAAAGVNRHDRNQRRAGPEYDPNPVPGLEVAGTIVALGSVVPRSRLGERAAALTQSGGYARSVATASALALPAPRSLGLVEAAALPEALFTAWFNFFDVLRLRLGERVLIHGGTSAVASLAIQALTGLGHEVFATCGSDRKRAAALGFGARAAFDYKHTGLANQVKAATGGRGVDVILDVSAGAHPRRPGDAGAGWSDRPPLGGRREGTWRSRCGRSWPSGSRLPARSCGRSTCRARRRSPSF